MATAHKTYNLTATPVFLDVIADSGKDRRGMTIIFNTDKQSNDTAMIGTSTVTDTDFGFHMDADREFVISGNFNYTDKFYARAKTTTAILHVMVVGA